MHLGPALLTTNWPWCTATDVARSRWWWTSSVLYMKRLSDIDSINVEIKYYLTNPCRAHTIYDGVINGFGKMHHVYTPVPLSWKTPCSRDTRQSSQRWGEDVEGHWAEAFSLPSERPHTKPESSLPDLFFAQESFKKSRTTDIATESLYINIWFTVPHQTYVNDFSQLLARFERSAKASVVRKPLDAAALARWRPSLGHIWRLRSSRINDWLVCSRLG